MLVPDWSRDQHAFNPDFGPHVNAALDGIITEPRRYTMPTCLGAVISLEFQIIFGNTQTLKEAGLQLATSARNHHRGAFLQPKTYVESNAGHVNRKLAHI